MGGSSSEQAWTGPQSWPPDVTRRAGSCSEGGPVQWGLMCHGKWSHGTPPCGQTDRQTHKTENITFLQLCWRVVKNCRFYPLEDIPGLKKTGGLGKCNRNRQTEWHPDRQKDRQTDIINIDLHTDNKDRHLWIWYHIFYQESHFNWLARLWRNMTLFGLYRVCKISGQTSHLLMCMKHYMSSFSYLETQV